MEEKIIKLINNLTFEIVVLENKSEEMEDIDKNAHYWYNGQIKMAKNIKEKLVEILK